MNQCISLDLSNSSQLYQIRGQPLTIATHTTTLTNPSATVGGNDPFQTGTSEEEDEEEEEGERETELSSGATREKVVGMGLALSGLVISAVVLVL